MGPVELETGEGQSFRHVLMPHSSRLCQPHYVSSQSVGIHGGITASCASICLCLKGRMLLTVRLCERPVRRTKIGYREWKIG